MRSHASRRFWSCFDSLPPEIQKQARSAFALWTANPSHPSLQFKPIDSGKDYWSVRIGLQWRALGRRTEDTIIWFWIGSHSEYDQMLRRR